MYEKILLPVLEKKKSMKIKIGLAWGFAEFSKFFVMAAIILAASEIIIRFDASTQDVFAAMMVLIFCVSAAGQEFGKGRDIGVALASIGNIFNLVDEPSPIDAVGDNSDSSK